VVPVGACCGAVHFVGGHQEVQARLRGARVLQHDQDEFDVVPHGRHRSGQRAVDVGRGGDVPVVVGGSEAVSEEWGDGPVVVVWDHVDPVCLLGPGVEDGVDAGAVAVVPVGDGAGDVPVGVVEDVGEGGGADEPGCAGEEQVSHGGDGRHPTVKIIPLW